MPASSALCMYFANSNSIVPIFVPIDPLHGAAGAVDRNAFVAAA